MSCIQHYILCQKIKSKYTLDEVVLMEEGKEWGIIHPNTYSMCFSSLINSGLIAVTYVTMTTWQLMFNDTNIISPQITTVY